MKSRNEQVLIPGHGLVDVCMESPKESARCVFIFAHGAGAGMNHPFMVNFSNALVDIAIEVVRFNFLYMQKKKSQPDKPDLAQDTLVEIMSWVKAKHPDALIFLGGKSFGGRMASHIPLKIPGVTGLILVSYPFHAPGKPGTERSIHFKDLTLPVLIMEGTKDTFATQPFANTALSWLKDGAVYWLEGYDHGLTNKKNAQLFGELAQVVDGWLVEKFSI